MPGKWKKCNFHETVACGLSSPRGVIERPHQRHEMRRAGSTSAVAEVSDTEANLGNYVEEDEVRGRGLLSNNRTKPFLRAINLA